MLLSMHVHFLIIINIHISGILLKLVSQCASIFMTHFFISLHIIFTGKSTVTVQRLLSSRCCLKSWCPMVVVHPLLFKQLLSNCWCLNSWCPSVGVQPLLFEQLLSNGCCLNRCYPSIAIQPLLSIGCYLNSCYPSIVVQLLLFELSSDFLTIFRVIDLHFKRDWFHWKAKTRDYKFFERRRT